MTKKQIGDIIKHKRKAGKMSAYYIAKTTRVMPNQLASIEQGDKSYTIDSLLKVAELLNLQLSCKNKV